MIYTKFYFILVLVFGLFSFSCSDLKDNVTLPTNVSVHGVSVYNPTSQNFHGLTVKEKGLESCKQCHSSNFSGGTTGVDCSQCHQSIEIHQADINNLASAGFHGKYIAARNWDMTKCMKCHGLDYSGGIASTSCKTCHTSIDGPEACNTCHGSFANSSMIAPPTDLARHTETTFAGVGAHSTHLYNAKLGPVVKCTDCHIVPAVFKSQGHIDNTPKAEIIMTKYSDFEIGSAAYNSSTFKCANTYCHGGFSISKANSNYQFAYTSDKIEGENFQPIWNKVDGSQAQCGTCHGLPPKGHMSSELKSCATCHQGIVDIYGKIIDKFKHINGKINVFGI